MIEPRAKQVLPQKRHCEGECDGTYDEDIAFQHKRRRNHKGAYYVYIVPVCLLCQQTARDTEKEEDPWLNKVESSIASHAKKYGLSAPVFRRRFGWDINRLVYVMSHAYNNTCEYCYRSYKEMRNGLADITIDIVNPQEPPYFPENVKPCCRTCNTEKGSMSPERWSRRRIYNREWAEQLKKSRQNPRQSSLLFAAEWNFDKLVGMQRATGAEVDAPA